MEQRAIADLLGKTALFGSLADADRAAIAARMRRVDFDPDQMIFSRGDPRREIYLVLEGRIRLSILSSDGRELSFAHADASPDPAALADAAARLRARLRELGRVEVSD